MTTKYKLAIIPEGYKVVPEEVFNLYEFMKASFVPFTGQHEQINISLQKAIAAMKDYQPLNTPPVLRWEGDVLMMLGCLPMAYIYHTYPDCVTWTLNSAHIPQRIGNANGVEEARRAAEKALEFPDGLVVEVV